MTVTISIKRYDLITFHNYDFIYILFFACKLLQVTCKDVLYIHFWDKLCLNSRI